MNITNTTTPLHTLCSTACEIGQKRKRRHNRAAEEPFEKRTVWEEYKIA